MSSRHRTDALALALADLQDALRQVGLTVEAGAGDNAVISDGAAHDNWTVRVVPRSTVTETRLPPTSGDENAYCVVVADVVTEGARLALHDRSWGFLDRRGALSLRHGGLRVEASIKPAFVKVPHHGSAISGRGGRAMALALLLSPFDPPGVREVARRAEMTPSTVHAALQRLRDAHLVDHSGHAILPDLFWELSKSWQPNRVALARVPRFDEVRRLYYSSVETDGSHPVLGAIGGINAAVFHGAGLVFDEETNPPDYYVGGEDVLRKTVVLFRRAESWQSRAATVAVAPSRVAVQSAVLENADDHCGWVTPVVAALDLSLDKGRGQEALQDWRRDDGLDVWHTDRQFT